MTTRSKNKYAFIFPEKIDKTHKIIGGSKLPTYKQVLMSFLAWKEWYKDNDSTKKLPLLRNAANSTVEQVQTHYTKARIPTLQSHKMAERVEELFREFKNQLKVEKKSRDHSSKKLLRFKEKLGKTMPLWPRDTLKSMEESKLRKKEEEQRVESMMTYSS
jgi:hypothetical protein